MDHGPLLAHSQPAQHREGDPDSLAHKGFDADNSGNLDAVEVTFDLRYSTSPGHWLDVCYEETADEDRDNIETDPEKVGKVKAVVLLLDTMIRPLSQQRVFDVSKYVYL